MAIQVNGTEVISNSRALNNIASIDATTVAALGAAGVGGANVAESTVLNPSLATWDARSAPEALFNYQATISGLPASGTYATIKTFTGSALVGLSGELNTTATSDATFMTNYSTYPGEPSYSGYFVVVYYYDASANTSQQVLFGKSTDGRASAFFAGSDAEGKATAIIENWPRLSMSLRVAGNGDKILLSMPSANYWGGSFTLNANVLKFKFIEVT